MNKYYKILGVNSDISDDELRATHRALLKRYHPDTYLGDKDYASKKTAEINEAYAEIVAYREKNFVKTTSTKENVEIKNKKEEKQNIKKEENKPQKPNVDYSTVKVENSAEEISKKYKQRELSLEERRSKKIIDILIYSLSAITIGLILFMIFYR